MTFSDRITCVSSSKILQQRFSFPYALTTRYCPCYRSHKHFDQTAGSGEHSDNSSTHICYTRSPAKVWPKYSILEITPSYIQVGMFRSPRTLFDEHLVLNVEIELQDPLNSIPLLLSCDDPAAGDLLSLIEECCSAKEPVIAVQEAVDRLEVSFNSDHDGFEEVDQKVPQQAASSPIVRLSLLTRPHAACELFSFSIYGKGANDTQRSQG